MQTYFSSDFHLGHKAITKYRTQFSSMEEHDEAILTMLESFPKRTLMHILGDFLFDGPNLNYYLLRLSNLPYKIKLVMGNHDSKLLYSKCPSNIEIQLPLYSYKNMWISHCPIHPQELRSRILSVHGHLHGGIVHHCDGEPDERYFNVNLDNNNFKPVPIETINSYAQGLK